MVPEGAIVYAMAIEMRIDQVDSFSFSHANRYRSRNEYQPVNMMSHSDKWRALSDPVEIFDFDFYNLAVHMVSCARWEKERGKG